MMLISVNGSHWRQLWPHVDTYGQEGRKMAKFKLGDINDAAVLFEKIIVDGLPDTTFEKCCKGIFSDDALYDYFTINMGALIASRPSKRQLLLLNKDKKMIPVDFIIDYEYNP